MSHLKYLGTITRRILIFGAVAALCVCVSDSQTTCSIKGKVIDRRSTLPLPFVNVIVRGTTFGASTNLEGEFEIRNLPPGKYTLVATLVGHERQEIGGVTITKGEEFIQNISLVDASVQLGDVTVFGASMRGERVIEAPASVSVLSPKDIKLRSVSGQVPRLLETEAGVDIAQSGINDFNLNTRGFNKSLNRRLLVLLDGRDLAVAFLGSQEWNGLSVPVEDLGKLELIRGPASALYGANAFNGVVNILTPSPRDIVGGKVTIAGGEMNTVRTDVRYAGISGPWSYKMNAGRFQGDTWAVSRRVPPFEYEGLTRDLNIEKADLNRSKVASTYGSARLDYEYVDGTMSTAEAGITQVENEVLVTGIGRVQVPKAIKPWGRVSYNSNHWYVQLWGAGRNSLRPQVSLALDLPLEEQSFIGQADVQYRFSGLDENLSVILGAAHRYQSVDTKGTLTLMAHHDNLSGLYAQIEYKILDELKSIIAGRWDRSTLHESQFSPKIALVWSPVPGHSFRATFNKAFQAPNYAELFLHVVPPKDPSQFVQLAFFGNEHLSVEKITGYELGYKGVFGDVLFLSVDGYYNQLRDFITDLTPNVNLQYGGSETLPGENFERTIFSYGNAGKVNEAGFEVSMNYYLTNALQFNANYSFFTFEVTEEHTEHDLLPNAPGYKINGGVSYGVDDWQIGLSVKYVPTFDWKAGVYRTDPVTGRGRVVAYTLLNVNASYKFTPHLELGLNVTNLLDRQHYEILGGSLIGRRALASLTAFF